MIVPFGRYNIHCNEDRFINEVIRDEEYAFYDSDKVIIDIGANIGTFSIYMYKRASVIYAIEPSPEYEYLETNIKENGLVNIKPFKLAITGTNGTRRLLLTSYTGGSQINDNATTGSIEVESRTLATFIKENDIKHVDLVKIDIEGVEYEVFKSPDMLEVADRIDCIVGELHGSGADMEQIMMKNGFNFKQTGAHFISRRIK